MRRLHDYLDYDWVKVYARDGMCVEGRPISVIYADESPSGEDELDVENRDGITGFAESEIEHVEILK